MTKAPDRIWAVHRETLGAVMIGEWADTIRHLGGTEYVRADIAQAAEPPKVEQSAADVSAERITLANAVFVASRTIDGDEAQAIADALIAAGWRRDSAELRAAATDVLKRWDRAEKPLYDVMLRLRCALRGKS